MIIDISEIWDDRSAKESEDGTRTYTRSWRVRTDDQDDDAQTVKLASGIPRKRDPYVTATSVDLGALAISIDAKQDQGSPILWIVTVEYSSKQPEVGAEEENPLARPAEIDWGRNFADVPIDRDLTGKSIKTSAGEPFDPSLQRRARILTLTITKIRANYDPVALDAYTDAVNLDSFFGFPPGTVKCVGITGKSFTENDTLYWTVTYPFEIRARGWKEFVLDKGNSYLDANGNPKLFEDGEGRTQSGPQLLNGAGKPLSETHSTLIVNAILGPCTPQSPQIYVDDSDVFGPVPFVVKVESELMLVTEVPDDGILKVTRGYSGTTAAAHANDVVVQQEPYWHEYSVCTPLKFSRLQLP